MKAWLRVVLVISALVGAGCSEDPPAASTPTAMVASTAEVPAASVSPTTAHPSTSANPFDAFRLEPAVGFIELVRGVEQIPPERIGAFFMDVRTGAVEGWVDLIGRTNPVAFSGDNRLVLFENREQVFQAGVTYPAGPLLADRTTGKVYRWQGPFRPVLANSAFNGRQLTTTAGPQGTQGRVLLRYEDAAGPDWFGLVDLDAAGRVVLTFQTEGAKGLLSRDGKYAAVFGDVVQIIELATGRSLSLPLNASPTTDLSTAALLETADGRGFLLSAGSSERDRQGIWVRHTWEGTVVASGTSSGEVFPSPGGGLVAVVTPLLTAQAPPPPAKSNATPPEPWYIFNAVDTSSGRDIFRVVGVNTTAGYTTGNRWLADGSGLVVSDASYKLVVAMSDGTFRPYVGMPSPDNKDLFATGSPVDGWANESTIVTTVGPSVRDASGSVIVSTSPEGRSRSFVPPWGLVGSEMRFLTPHGGHGGIGYALSLVEPVVERPPYAQTPSLRLRAEAAGSPLFDAPAGSQSLGALGTVPRVEVTEVISLRLESTQPGYAEYCRLFNRLSEQPAATVCRGVLWGAWGRTAQGWLLLQLSPEGA